jgi:predicted NBD/HSP70 family sugar kinase
VNIVNELIHDKVLVKSGFAPSDVGRQSVLFSINGTANFAIGIDLDFPPIRIAISDLAGNQIYADSWEMSPESDIKNVAISIVKHIVTALTTMKLDKLNCRGIGLGVPSIKNDTRDGKKISVARIRGWGSLDISEYLEKNLDIKVFLRNDAQLISLSEHSLRKDPSTSFLFILWRWGIGMAIFINGKLYEGTFGNGGQISHLVINAFSDDECYCGNYGCLELYASKKAILQAYQNKSSGKKNVTDIADIFELGDRGDSTVVEILEKAGKALGTGISSVVKLLDIPTVIISGLHCSKTNPFWQTLQQTVKKYTFHSTIEEPTIVQSVITEEFYAMGGCYYVLNTFFGLHRPDLNGIENYMESKS